ncbi:ProQ/FINO family protein [Vreelandella sulfidaeris]
MAASLTNLLDDLEMRLERTQAELEALRDENQQLKQQLARQDARVQSEPSLEAMPSAEAMPAAERSSEETFNPVALEDDAQEQEQEAVSGNADLPPVDEPAKIPSPHALLNQWYERYPNAFFKGHTRPLKVGIHQDLAEREHWPNKLIRRALANYVNLPRYIKAVREGAERVDLDGQPAGKVDKEAALHASEKRGEKKERTDKEERGYKEKRREKEKREQPKKAQPKSSLAAKKPHKETLTEPQDEKTEKSESRKPLSMEDKLLGLQQKFKGR